MEPTAEQRFEAANIVRQPYNNWETIEMEVALETLDAVRTILHKRIDKRYADVGDTV